MDGDKTELAEVSSFDIARGYGTAVTNSGVKIYFLCDCAPGLSVRGQMFAATYGSDRWCVDINTDISSLTIELKTSNIEIVE